MFFALVSPRSCNANRTIVLPERAAMGQGKPTSTQIGAVAVNLVANALILDSQGDLPPFTRSQMTRASTYLCTTNRRAGFFQCRSKRAPSRSSAQASRNAATRSTSRSARSWSNGTVGPMFFACFWATMQGGSRLAGSCHFPKFLRLPRVGPRNMLYEPTATLLLRTGTRNFAAKARMRLLTGCFRRSTRWSDRRYPRCRNEGVLVDTSLKLANQESRVPSALLSLDRLAKQPKALSPAVLSAHGTA